MGYGLWAMALRIVGLAGSTMPLFIVRRHSDTPGILSSVRALLVMALGPIGYGYSETEQRRKHSPLHGGMVHDSACQRRSGHGQATTTSAARLKCASIRSAVYRSSMKRSTRWALSPSSDLAIERDPESALGDISAARPDKPRVPLHTMVV